MSCHHGMAVAFQPLICGDKLFRLHAGLAGQLLKTGLTENVHLHGLLHDQ